MTHAASSARPSVAPSVLALLVCLAATVAGCSVAEAPINRVQANLVDKKIFEGEWWHSSTIVDTDYDAAWLFGANGAPSPFTGSMSSDLGADPSGSFPIARIVWVIDEKFIYAYRSHELVVGGNDDATSPEFRGQPLAAYRIEAHVDIRREYNQVTGEQTNVTSENTTDRRWFERDLMRVDWSQNRITDFAPNQHGYAALLGSFTRESSSFVADPASIPSLPASYAPQFMRLGNDPDYRFASEWPASESDTVHYMSFVNREIWSPGSNCGACSTVNVTVRSAFLRVPPLHEYAVETSSNQEFDRFGIFRSHARTYARGGRDRESLAIHCFDDEDCGVGGACDQDREICVGGLTDDRGETDFLAFQRSRLNFYGDSLLDTECAADWQCDLRHVTCDPADEPEDECPTRLRNASGSVCDIVARRCTVPIRSRVVRPVHYWLSPHFPPHLVRNAFASIGHWNEPLMAGQRAAKALLPVDEAPCDVADDLSGICTTDVRRDVRQSCQTSNPGAYCFCGSPEAEGGDCAYKYDPFENPSDARERGVPNPYDCFIEGPADATAPGAYQDYGAEVYGYRFVGRECMLLLHPNNCDVDSTLPCQELGDLRYQFLNLVEHGGAWFSGVALPLSDPTTGELVVSNSNVALESLEYFGTQASQFYPVLRGEVPEDQYFSGEHVRGYYGRVGRAEHPVSIAPSFGEGYDPEDPTRPASSSDMLQDMQDRIDRVAPRVEQLRGTDGRARIYSDRVLTLAESSQEAQLVSAVEQNSSQPQDGPQGSTRDELIARLSPFRTDHVSAAEALREHDHDLGNRNVCRLNGALFNARYAKYWANAFEGRPLAEASLRMQQTFFQAVMLHEIGHSLGLRHNFAGSLDRNNYQDAYYGVARRVPLPAFTDYDDPSLGGDGSGSVTGEEALRWAKDLREARELRLELGIGNTTASSIMDYEGDTSSYGGLGRYDHAAAIFNYFNGAEAFVSGDPTLPEDTATSLRDLVNSDQVRRVVWSYYRGGESCTADADCPNDAESETTARQPIFQRCVTNPRDGGRSVACSTDDVHCICSDFHNDFKAYTDGVAYRSSNQAPTFTPVQYLYCNDERTNDLSWCTRYDAGESFQEVVEHYRGSWHDRYPSRYFRNFRASGPTEAGSYSSVVDAAKIFQHLWFRRSFEPGFRTNFGPLGYNDQILASIDTMNWYAEIIGLPDVGAYTLDADANVYRKVSDDPNASQADFGLQPGEGYYLWSAYQEGLNGFSRMERSGTFLDKFYAIEALARRDWGLNFTLDERYNVNFFDLFETEVTELFGGLILRNPRWYAPRVAMDAEGEPTLRYLSLYRGLERDSQDVTYPEPAVDGSDTEVLRDWATIQALANFPVYYDTSFEQRMLVFKLGSGDGYDIPATRPDGTPTCGYADSGCTEPDYVVYDSDRVHTSYVAVQISPGLSQNRPEQQITYQLLTGLYDRQEEVRALTALPSRTAAQEARLRTLRLSIERDESFLEYLIELARTFGVSAYLF